MSTLFYYFYSALELFPCGAFAFKGCFPFPHLIHALALDEVSANLGYCHLIFHCISLTHWVKYSTKVRASQPLNTFYFTFFCCCKLLITKGLGRGALGAELNP